MSNITNTKFDPFCKKEHKCKDCTNRCVNHIAFLNDLPYDIQNSLMENSQYIKYKKGSYIFEEGDTVGSINIIRKGEVKLTTIDSEGHERIVGIFKDNDTIWEGIFREGSKYPYSGVCLTDTHICKIYKKDVEKSVSNQSVAFNVISMLSRKLHDANKRNMILSISDPEAKIASFLIYISSRSNGDVVQLKLDDIAASVGLRPETVSRKLNGLMDKQYIKRIGQSGIKITNFNALKELVDNN